jgi:hypothetical protein
MGTVAKAKAATSVLAGNKPPPARVLRVLPKGKGASVPADWEWSAEHVGTVALRALERLAELSDRSLDDDREWEKLAAAVAVGHEAVAALRGDARARANVLAWYERLAGERAAKMGEAVWLAARDVQREERRDQPRPRFVQNRVRVLLVSLARAFGPAYAKLSAGDVLALLRTAVLVQPRKGQHTVGHVTIEIQRLAGEKPPRTKAERKTRRETIDDRVKARFR